MTELTTITARGQKAIDKYFKAIDRARNSAWGVAKVVTETVKSDKFDEDFGSLTTYAAAIGLSKSSVSLQVRAYTLYTELPETLAEFTYTAVCSLLPLVAAGVDVNEFLEAHEIDSKTSVSTIKTDVKSFLEAIAQNDEDFDEEFEDDGDEVVSGEVEETDEDEETNKTNKTDTYNVPAGTNFVVINGNIITLDDDDLAAIEEVLNV